jgi:hypothetical protein
MSVRGARYSVAEGNGNEYLQLSRFTDAQMTGFVISHLHDAQGTCRWAIQPLQDGLIESLHCLLVEREDDPSADNKF